MFIPRENIIVFGVNLKLGINLRRIFVIEFYNSGFIWSLLHGFSLQVDFCVLYILYFRILQVLGKRLLQVVHDVKVKDDGYGELVSPEWGEPRVVFGVMSPYEQMGRE